ncbi:SCO family protein [uncultured Psychroserpens sp.]|uniref:SCO family protein n=1 Tax=uncultured Psychroserpens sp. TaxID=255436 RepID=UPI002631F800|nr:SCO family protein [uncultured Psychroserpens sp.]
MRLSFFLSFLLFLACNGTTKELPILSYKIDNKGAKVYYSISYNGFVNQDNEVFDHNALDSKVYIANFFFTKCPSICPPMRNELIKIAEAFLNKDDFVLVSHTIDPSNDTVSVLNNYAKATSIPKSKWQFVRASETQTMQLAKQYMTNFKLNNYGTDFYHSSYVALVDRTQQIRGFYNVLNKEEVKRLKKDIFILID